MRCPPPLVLLLLAAMGSAQENAPNRILRPVDGAVIADGKIEMIAKLVSKGQLLLDGKILNTRQKAPGVITYALETAAGLHVLELQFEGGTEKVRFAAGPAPEGEVWKPFRLHPPAATCETCHAVISNVWELKHAKLETSCGGCHNALKGFAANHQHNTTQLADCALCHNPHGSTTQFHMRYPRAVACKLCHG